MTISDCRYFKLVETLTDMQAGTDRYVVMGRAFVEHRVQVALCAADIYPASSADRDPAHPSEIDQGLAGLGSMRLH
ncbi:hypothetical protein [Bradyrhizobium neotropicale]|uniref:Uncharacterized protein n=1 Tax=Bradyrhizobium neotropicale TaxID=1497615 RepID=A0A176Z392_9BRAD|nr:hypothetical protein [Bradyrhizobium neotropicale]OAF13916.1 hypothetical protein AXW67_18210 [Bradyrhizobium neotropicale]